MLASANISVKCVKGASHHICILVTIIETTDRQKNIILFKHSIMPFSNSMLKLNDID